MPDDDIKRAIRAGWDAMSRSYQADSEISTSDLHYAPLAGGERYYRLLGDANNLRGLRALELACGGAQNSVALTKWGADVVALDFSPNQLRHAMSLRRDEGTRFDLVAGDMASPTMFKPESFDLILSSFGWEFAPDLGGCVAACAELLRPGGRLLMATVHPLTAFDWNRAGRTLLVTDYFNPPVEVWDDPVPEGYAPGLTFFRTMEELVGSITDAGLSVERLIEPYPLPIEDAGASPYAGEYWADHRERLNHAPFAAVILGRKAG